jgi:septal ring factor EnvC (AmiA/AmiB activator)
MKPKLTAIALLLGLLVSGTLAPQGSSGTQLERLRSRIRTLEEQLAMLKAESADVAREREQLSAQLELAEARVSENELLLERSRAELERLRGEVGRLASELTVRREMLRHHLEMTALLGRPGPLQLLYDAARGGDLEQAVGTVAVLTAGQVRLLQEYDELRDRHSARLAELSSIMERAQDEARALVARRRELEDVRVAVEARLKQLERSQRSTGNRLAEMREREQALGRLMGVLASKERWTGKEDIRSYRGALPWPARGTVVRTFGRHYVPKYTTYTVCNGLRFDVPSGAAVQAVFPGVVAYAQHFRGYGNMVVIDHGRDVYSLVAGLATIHVRLNQRVSMGLQLGLAAPPADDGNLYFEIRVGETPEDPRRWLELAEDR